MIAVPLSRTAAATWHQAGREGKHRGGRVERMWFQPVCMIRLEAAWA